MNIMIGVMSVVDMRIINYVNDATRINIDSDLQWTDIYRRIPKSL
jgi:hypothetical protein